MGEYTYFAEELATVLDDNPDLSPRQIIEFERMAFPFGDLADIGAYRDWLEENGYKQRMSELNLRLKHELGEMQQILKNLLPPDGEVKDFAPSVAFVQRRISLLEALLTGAEFPARGKPIRGVSIIRFPEVGNAQQQMELRQRACELAQSLEMGSVIAMPSIRDHTGAYAWDFRIEGGDPSQVIVERQGESS